MKAFECITPNKKLCGPPCVLIIPVEEGGEPENCPYRIWSGVESPDWQPVNCETLFKQSGGIEK